MNDTQLIDEKLKPCPFCGNEAEVFGEILEGYGIQCKECGCCTPTFNDGIYSQAEEINIPTAVAMWNRRTV